MTLIRAHTVPMIADRSPTAPLLPVEIQVSAETAHSYARAVYHPDLGEDDEIYLTLDDLLSDHELELEGQLIELPYTTYQDDIERWAPPPGHNPETDGPWSEGE